MSLDTRTSGSDVIPLMRLDTTSTRPRARNDGRAQTWLEHRWNHVVVIVRIAAAGALLASVALHPFFVSRLTSDGQLEARSRELLYGLEGIAALAAIGVWRLARASERYTLFKEQVALGVMFCLASIVGGTTAMEGGLRLIHAFGTPLQASRHYFFSSDALLGWRHRAGSIAMFKGTRVAINSAGLRDDELHSAADGSRFRMLFLGDSQIFGDGVSHEETFIELLESQFRGVDAINAGVIGYGTDQQLLYYERDGLALHPNLTIVGLNAYDLRDNISTSVRSGYQKPMFDIRGGSLALTNVPVDPGSVVDRAQRWLSGSSHLYATAARITREPRARSADDDSAQAGTAPDLSAETVFPPARQMPRALEMTRLILYRLSEKARESGGQFAVMFLPYRMDLGDDREYQAHTEAFVDALKGWGTAAGFPMLDLRDALRTETPKDLFLDAMHFSPQGHQRVAHAAHAWLIQLGLVPRAVENR